MPQLARLSAQAPALGTSTQQSRGDTPMPGAGDTAMKRADFTKLMEELKDLAFG